MASCSPARTTSTTICPSAIRVSLHPVADQRRRDVAHRVAVALDHREVQQLAGAAAGPVDEDDRLVVGIAVEVAVGDVVRSAAPPRPARTARPPRGRRRA